MDNGWTLIALIFGIAFLYVWYEDYDKRRRSEEQERTERLQRRRNEDRIQAANEATLRAAIQHRRAAEARSDEQNRTDLFRAIGTETDEAWQSCPTLEPVHRHWWGLVNAASLQLSRADNKCNTAELTEIEFRELFLEVESEVSETEWTFEDVRHALDCMYWPDDDDSYGDEVVAVEVEEFSQALDAAVSLLAERRPNDAELIRRALSGVADAPGYFCAAEVLEAMRESVSLFSGDRSPDHADPPFSYLT
jgi:hypothetical protein